MTVFDVRSMQPLATKKLKEGRSSQYMVNDLCWSKRLDDVILVATGLQKVATSSNAVLTHAGSLKCRASVWLGGSAVAR